MDKQGKAKGELFSTAKWVEPRRRCPRGCAHPHVRLLLAVTPNVAPFGSLSALKQTGKYVAKLLQHSKKHG